MHDKFTPALHPLWLVHPLERLSYLTDKKTEAMAKMKNKIFLPTIINITFITKLYVSELLDNDA